MHCDKAAHCVARKRRRAFLRLLEPVQLRVGQRHRRTAVGSVDHRASARIQHIQHPDKRSADRKADRIAAVVAQVFSSDKITVLRLFKLFALPVCSLCRLVVVISEYRRPRDFFFLKIIDQRGEQSAVLIVSPVDNIARYDDQIGLRLFDRIIDIFETL